MLISTLWVAVSLGLFRDGVFVVAGELEPGYPMTIDLTRLARSEATGAKNVGPSVHFGLGLVQKVAEFDDANH